MRDISYIHVDMYCPKIKIVYFQLMLKQSAEDSLMVIEKMKQMNVTPDAITTTIQFHWASALVGIGVKNLKTLHADIPPSSHENTMR